MRGNSRIDAQPLEVRLRAQQVLEQHVVEPRNRTGDPGEFLLEPVVPVVWPEIAIGNGVGQAVEFRISFLAGIESRRDAPQDVVGFVRPSRF